MMLHIAVSLYHMGPVRTVGEMLTSSSPLLRP